MLKSYRHRHRKSSLTEHILCIWSILGTNVCTHLALTTKPCGNDGAGRLGRLLSTPRGCRPWEWVWSRRWCCPHGSNLSRPGHSAMVGQSVCGTNEWIFWRHVVFCVPLSPFLSLSWISYGKKFVRFSDVMKWKEESEIPRMTGAGSQSPGSMSGSKCSVSEDYGKTVHVGPQTLCPGWNGGCVQLVLGELVTAASPMVLGRCAEPSSQQGSPVLRACSQHRPGLSASLLT